MADWDEIEKLQAEFQQTQQNTSTQRLSERSCVEILLKLQKMKLITVLHTVDGKEYITPKHLKKEIKDELRSNIGRISLIELKETLNVDYIHIESKANEIVKSDRTIQLLNGQLIDVNYLDHVADIVNESLQAKGYIKIAELCKEYDLPSDFLLEEFVSRIGTRINGKTDDHNPDILFTDAYLSRQKALIRGMLSASTKPISLQPLVTEHGLSVPLIHSLISKLISEGRIIGEVVGGRCEKAWFYPRIYIQSQDKWIESFYQQNQYIEYDSVVRLGIFNAKAHLQKKLVSGDEIFLKTVCVNKSWKDRILSSIEEMLIDGEWLDVMTLMPSSFSEEDVGQLLQMVLNEKAKEKKSESLEVFCETVVAKSTFLQTCLNLFKGVINEKANAESKKSSVLALTEEERKEYLNTTSAETGRRRGGKKDDRKKKALEGGSGSKKSSESIGGGSGSGAREVKTKGKDKKRMKWARLQEVDDKENNVKSENEFMSNDEVSSFLSEHLPECHEGLLIEVSEKLQKPLNQLYNSALQSIFILASKQSETDQTHATSRKSNLRSQLRQVEEDLMLVWNKARLYHEGIQLFSNDLKSNFEKYLLKTVGTDIVNKIVLLNTSESMTDIDLTMDITAQIRIKIISLCPNSTKLALTQLNNALNGKSFENFNSCLSEAAKVCGIKLKQNDKKKDRVVVHGNRVSLLKQMENENDLALVLHMVSTVIFQSVFGCLLHAPGRFVPDILAKLESNVDRETYIVLMKAHDLIRQKIILDQADVEDDEIITQLAEFNVEMEQVCAKIKELAVTTKKKK